MRIVMKQQKITIKQLGGKVMEYIGRFWNDKDIEIYKIDNRNIALNGWNGEKFVDCFELDNNLIDIIKTDIVVVPICDLQNENVSYIGYEIEYN